MNRILVGWLVSALAVSAQADWAHYGGDAGGSQSSELTQITRDNVDELELVWTHRSGDLGAHFPNKGHTYQATPVHWQGRLFLSTSANLAIAVDAATGEEAWRFDPGLPGDAGYSESASRGVSLWHGETGDCPDKVVYGTLTGLLIALDATTGKRCPDFADAGVYDLARDVGGGEYRSLGDYGVTSPPVIFGDLIIVGSAIGDNRAVGLERGIVRALSAVTGELVWQWDPVPRSPADPHWDTWGKGSGAITGAANAWPPLSLDEERGLVFVPTGSPSPDFYGGERPGSNLYANSLVALAAGTGKVVWHQQLVHHDIWDYDLPAQPTLTDMTVDGQSVPAVLQVTKTGMLYAFHRETGAPLIPIEERPVPASDLPGEETAPTQPYSTLPPLADQSPVTADDAFGIMWFDRKACIEVIEASRSEGLYTPPSTRGSIMNPGWAGGANWGGVAVDAERQIAITNVMQLPGLLKVVPRTDFERMRDAGEFDGGWEVTGMFGTPYFMMRRLFLSDLELPCTKPPWGKLVAVDLAGQKILWEEPLGTIEDIAPAPVPNFEWGVPNIGGPLVTGAGLTFIGAASDYYLRAYATETGELLWKTRLPTAAMATPMTVMAGGRQLVVVAVGGHTGIGLKRGDYLMAFALPR